jgi:LGFP repeat-containing protein
VPQLQFVSPRFIGDELLEEILNDPDTGTRKLQAGSPPASVTKVQQALFDLAWNLRADPAVEDENTFVDGNYGPATTRAVLNYKIYFNLHFPPSQPFGSYDGFAGPKTLAHLDSHIVLFDEAVTAINNKIVALEAAGIDVQAPVSNVFAQRIRIVPCAQGAVHLGSIAGADGAICFKRGVGAFEVHGPIFQTYGHKGGPNDVYGFPTSDERDDGPGLRRSDFENGSLRLHSATGQVDELGAAAAEPPVILF